jgi:3-phenylpropionate/trans-cinnamate dioxygenase ferredoxin subunit
MPRFVVARTDEIPRGGRKRVMVDGRTVVVFNLSGEFFAIGDTCPHKGGSLSEGKLCGLVRSNGPGDYRLERDGEIIRCPWHAWEFDIRTGRSYCDPRRMRTMPYPTATAQGRDIADGPYRAETFEVVSDEHYVLIDIAG